MTPYEAQLTVAGSTTMLARVVEPGVYQLGGSVDVVLWDVGAPPTSLSPQLAAGAVATVYLQRGAQLWVGPAAAMAAATQVALWLVWPDEG